MVSLWGSKKNNQQSGADEGDMDHDEEAPAHQSQDRAPPPRRRHDDERTPLLPPSREGYLSPDDPAVSPRVTFTHARLCLTRIARSHRTTSGLSER